MSRKTLKCLIAALLCLLLAAVPALLLRLQTGRLPELQAADQWQGNSEDRFAQVACFLDQPSAYQEQRVMSLRQSIDDELASQTDAAWTDCYSSLTTLSAKRDSGTVSARAICTGGSFFLFHPVELISGTTYSDDDPYANGVLLDMELAWKLFGGYDLAGMELTINNIPVYVTGVVRTPDTSMELEAYGETPTVWLPMSLAARMGTPAAFTCYEAVLPDPVENFAINTLDKVLSMPESACEIVQNSGRLDYIQSLKNLTSFGARSIRQTRIVYPYWQNTANLAENRCAIYAGLMTLLLLYPALFLIYWVLRIVITAERKIKHKIARHRNLRLS